MNAAYAVDYHRSVLESFGLLYEHLLNHFTLGDDREPGWVFLRLGGMFSDQAIVASELVANHDCRSLLLYRQLSMHIRESFLRERDYYIGSDALKAARNGYRLTQNVRCGREFDFPFP